MECKLNVAVAVERCGLAGVWGGVCARNEKSARRFQEHTGGSDGKYPWTAGVAIGSGPSGHPVLYGTTNYGGTTSCYLGCGTVFSLTPPASPGGSWTEAVLYSFQGGLTLVTCYPFYFVGSAPTGYRSGRKGWKCLMKETSKVRKIAFVGGHLPRKCGIATFTSDLLAAVAIAGIQPSIVLVLVSAPPALMAIFTAPSIGSFKGTSIRSRPCS